MANTPRHLTKANEKLNKALESFESQAKRVNISKDELTAVRKSMDDLKSLISQLSFDDQEKKIAELDKLLAKENVLKMRVELLSGSNKEINTNLDEAGKYWEIEKQALSKEESGLYENYKKIEEVKEKARQENAGKIIELNTFGNEFTAKVSGLLHGMGWSKVQISDYAEKYHIGVN